MKWLVVLDPIEGLISRTDTSLALINKARERGHRVDTASIENLYFDMRARVVALDVDKTARHRDLDDYDLILMRKEPPYDLPFHYATHLLSLTKGLVVNRPSSLRDFNEKLIALEFSEYMPATLVSSDIALIRDFISSRGGGVIKSLDSFQGKSVQKIDGQDEDVIASFPENGAKNSWRVSASRT